MSSVPEGRAGRLADLAAASKDAQHTASRCRNNLDAEIVAAIDDDGAKISDVARVVGVSSTRVYAIIVAHSKRSV